MKITVLADGPLLVEGLTSLGASTTKPRCDGTQTKTGFRCAGSAALKPAPPAVAVWEGEGGSTPPAK